LATAKTGNWKFAGKLKSLEVSRIGHYTKREIWVTVPQRISYLGSESANSTESVKTARQGGFFVSGQEITLDLERSSSIPVVVGLQLFTYQLKGGF